MRRKPRKFVITRGFIVTTDPIEKYNGLSFPPVVMYSLLQQIRNGSLPLGIEHDRKQRLNYKLHFAEIRETKTGSLGVWVEMWVDEEDREKFENKHGFSVSIQVAFYLPVPTNTKPKLSIAIDPAHFDEETIQATIKELELYFAVEASYLYQLSDINTIIGAVINIAEGVVGSLITTGLCAAAIKLLSKSKDGQVSELIIEQGNKKTTLKSGDSKLLERQLDKLIPSERSYKKRNAHKTIARRQTTSNSKKSKKTRNH